MHFAIISPALFVGYRIMQVVIFLSSRDSLFSVESAFLDTGDPGFAFMRFLVSFSVGMAIEDWAFVGP
jgi:hypothetical protein